MNTVKSVFMNKWIETFMKNKWLTDYCGTLTNKVFFVNIFGGTGQYEFFINDFYCFFNTSTLRCTLQHILFS